jgi:hypothetical protein
MRYRIYLVGDNCRMQRTGEFQCPTDEKARRWLGEVVHPGLGAELWEGGRLIARTRCPGCETCRHERE